MYNRAIMLSHRLRIARLISSRKISRSSPTLVNYSCFANSPRSTVVNRRWCGGGKKAAFSFRSIVPSRSAQYYVETWYNVMSGENGIREARSGSKKRERTRMNPVYLNEYRRHCKYGWTQIHISKNVSSLSIKGKKLVMFVMFIHNRSVLLV